MFEQRQCGIFGTEDWPLGLFPFPSKSVPKRRSAESCDCKSHCIASICAKVSAVSNPGVLHHWIETLPSDGRYVFSRQDAESAGRASAAAVQATLRRMKKRGAIVSPRRGFYVTVPAEYRAAGSPPATWFIDDLMSHLGRRYYVGLLTAAALHGAAHQQPMAFQVVTDAVERPIEVGRIRIEFHKSQLLDAAATVERQTETGSMILSTPETTAFDLVRFPSAAGHWSNIATIVGELAEKMSPERLAAGAQRVARSDVQRLGYLLDLLGQSELAEALANALTGNRLVPVPLNTQLESEGAALDPRFRVLINDEVEPDS